MVTVPRRHRLAFLALMVALVATAYGCEDKTPAAKEVPAPARPTITLHQAAKTANVAQLEAHFHWGCDVNAKDAEGATPLHWAVRNGHKDVAELLISKGADVSAKDATGKTPLAWAVYGKHTAIATLLKQHGASDKEILPRPTMTLFEAASTGDVSQIDAHLFWGTDVNAKGGGEIGGWTALLLAVEGNKLEVARLLLDNRANVNARTGYGGTSLHLAAERGNADMIELLLDRGANVNAKTEGGDTPLDLAIAKGHTALAELLRRRGARPRPSMPLHEAVKAGDLEKVKACLAGKHDINAPDEEGWTPLHWAARLGHTAVAELLVANGAQVNVPNQSKEGTQPFHLALFLKSPDLANLLLSKGAKVDAKYSWGGTALHDASERGDRRMAEFLLSHGAQVDAKNDGGATPLYWAAEHGRKDVAELLIAKGADVGAKTPGGKTPLSVATEKSHRDVVELLKKHGAKQ